MSNIVQLSERQILELIKLAIQNENFQAAIGLIDDVLKQLPAVEPKKQNTI